VYSRIITVILLATIILALAIPSTHAGDNVGIHSDFPHARVVVTEVVDGDTVRISPPVYVAGQYRTVVRLADIDAPELDTPEGEWAKGNLTNLLAQYGGVVYLDIDKSSGVDDYGRIIAVVYIRVDESTLLNVNKWLVDNGYAVVDDKDNDFDPSKWSLYINYNVVNEKMPTVTRVVLASLPQGVHNATSWGVKVATTPDGNYIGLAFSEYGTYHLWVVILDKNGNVVRRVNLSDVAIQVWVRSMLLMYFAVCCLLLRITLVSSLHGTNTVL
jgi:endonuclease YncB( thermonuclease family)